MVAAVGCPQPDRLAMLDGDTDGVNARGGRGRVVVVVAPAGPPSSTSATARRIPQMKRPMPHILARRPGAVLSATGSIPCRHGENREGFDGGGVRPRRG